MVKVGGGLESIILPIQPAHPTRTKFSTMKRPEGYTEEMEKLADGY
jgi:hypothetical protein